jgi:outer membrane protein assembly factor BamB
MKNSFKKLLICTLTASLCACSFFDKDNTPEPAKLVSFKPEATVQSSWKKSANNGAGKEYLKLIPAASPTAIYTASRDGTVTANDKATGRTLWSVGTGTHISGGPSAGDGLVLVGTREGDVIALYQADGRLAWKAAASSEVLAAPAIHNNIVLAKSISGKLSAFSAQDGHTLWEYHQTEPTLILRGASSPQISNGTVIAGFANGDLANLSLKGGNMIWQQPIAIPQGSFAIERMIDVDADPVIYQSRVYAATYQGRISALELATGREIWNHDISSYTGMTNDNEKVYVTDAKSNVWAFDANSGSVDWRQTQLEARNITGPAMMKNYIVVGDMEGYLHWLSKTDGHFIARTKVTNSGILAAPIVDNNILYVVTMDGHVAAYTVS